jgi:hypothetical protein
LAGAHEDIAIIAVGATEEVILEAFPHHAVVLGWEKVGRHGHTVARAATGASEAILQPLEAAPA